MTLNSCRKGWKKQTRIPQEDEKGNYLRRNIKMPNWEVVEFQVLLQQSNNWVRLLDDLLGQLSPHNHVHEPVVAVLKDSASDVCLFKEHLQEKKAASSNRSVGVYGIR